MFKKSAAVLVEFSLLLHSYRLNVRSHLTTAVLQCIYSSDDLSVIKQRKLGRCLIHNTRVFISLYNTSGYQCVCFCRKLSYQLYIIHVGTNSLRTTSSSRQCADEIVDLARMVEQEGISTAISTLEQMTLSYLNELLRSTRCLGSFVDKMTGVLSSTTTSSPTSTLIEADCIWIELEPISWARTYYLILIVTRNLPLGSPRKPMALCCLAIIVSSLFLIVV